jgi:hypothetical protein
MIRLPAPPKPGDQILAGHIAALYEALDDLEVHVVAPLAKDSEGTIYFASDPGMWIKLTSRSGTAYAWTEQLAQTGGTWIAGPRTGTTAMDQAYDLNASTTVPTTGPTPTIVRAWRDLATSELRFAYGSC